MYWSSKALGWVIPSLFLKTPKNGTIIIISPWIENIKLQTFCWEGTHTLKGIVYLTAIIRWLYFERNIHFTFYVRDDQLEPTMNYRLAAIYREVSEIADFHGIRNLHAKLIITDSTVLETSANLLESSIYRNVENLVIHPNEDNDAKVFAKHFFTRQGLLIH